MATFLEQIASCLQGRGITFRPTYDSSVWAEFTLEGCDDVFHVMDMWNFGAVEPDALNRYILDRNVDPDAEAGEPERFAQTLSDLLEGL